MSDNKLNQPAELKIALHGATGRMGAAVFGVCREQGVQIVGAAAAPNCPEIGLDLGDAHKTLTYGVEVTSNVADSLLGANVIIDFSTAAAMPTLIKAATAAKIPVVSGTTGLDSGAVDALRNLGNLVPVLWAPNFSIGIEVLTELVRLAAKRLGPDFDIEIVEVHHRRKADAPSGTALRLAHEIEGVRDVVQCRGRDGLVGPRPAEELGVHAVRGGDVVGDHSVHILGIGERLELTHRATSREVFARGALFAARVIAAKSPGFYRLADILP
ncbi:MAG: 4-hydroxy-tetrahydrodipicolinate reductase [Polyangiaceae bacterium]|nr:4-hydroxy-tetrahydrodipicolinate reductase [Polyangiaceae bacterium]